MCSHHCITEHRLFPSYDLMVSASPSASAAPHVSSSQPAFPSSSFGQLGCQSPSSPPAHSTYHPHASSSVEHLFGASLKVVVPQGLGSRSTCFPCWSSSLSLVRILPQALQAVTTPTALQPRRWAGQVVDPGSNCCRHPDAG